MLPCVALLCCGVALLIRCVDVLFFSDDLICCGVVVSLFRCFVVVLCSCVNVLLCWCVVVLLC